MFVRTRFCFESISQWVVKVSGLSQISSASHPPARLRISGLDVRSLETVVQAREGLLWVLGGSNCPYGFVNMDCRPNGSLEKTGIGGVRGVGGPASVWDRRRWRYGESLHWNLGDGALR